MKQLLIFGAGFSARACGLRTASMFDKVIGTLDHPHAAIVFGEKGAGKTALRLLIGKKVAQRVVLDLKDKLGAEDLVIIDGPLADVREGLLGLGLSQQEASDAMNGLAPNRDAPVEDLLREALQHLGRG